MRRALAILSAAAFIGAVVYVSLLNPEAAEFHFATSRSVHWPLGVLVVLAFLIGAGLIIAAVTVESGRRAIATWRSERRRRRHRRIDEWEERGERLVWDGDPQRGRALLQKAWQRRPEDAHAVIALAASYRDSGELHRARGLLFDAAAQQHTNPDLLFALAEMHRAAGEAGPALEVLERLRALHPRAPRVLRALREAYIEARRWSDAAAAQDALIAELRDLQQVARERDRLVGLRYQAALALSDPTARLTALEPLAEGRSVAVPIAVSLGDALRACHRPDEASVLWEKALRATPRSVLVERLVGMATETRHRDRIRTVLRKLRSDQLNADHLRLLTAELHLADGQIDQAAHELEAIQDNAVAPGQVDLRWAEVHRRRGQVEQALQAFERAGAASRDYRCQTCERHAGEWVGYCLRCGAWDSYRAATELAAR